MSCEPPTSGSIPAYKDCETGFSAERLSPKPKRSNISLLLQDDAETNINQSHNIATETSNATESFSVSQPRPAEVKSPASNVGPPHPSLSRRLPSPPLPSLSHEPWRFSSRPVLPPITTLAYADGVRRPQQSAYGRPGQDFSSQPYGYLQQPPVDSGDYNPLSLSHLYSNPFAPSPVPSYGYYSSIQQVPSMSLDMRNQWPSPSFHPTRSFESQPYYVSQREPEPRRVRIRSAPPTSSIRGSRDCLGRSLSRHHHVDYDNSSFSDDNNSQLSIESSLEAVYDTDTDEDTIDTSPIIARPSRSSRNRAHGISHHASQAIRATGRYQPTSHNASSHRDTLNGRQALGNLPDRSRTFARDSPAASSFVQASRTTESGQRRVGRRGSYSPESISRKSGNENDAENIQSKLSAMRNSRKKNEQLTQSDTKTKIDDNTLPFEQKDTALDLGGTENSCKPSTECDVNGSKVEILSPEVNPQEISKQPGLLSPDIEDLIQFETPVNPFDCLIGSENDNKGIGASKDGSRKDDSKNEMERNEILTEGGNPAQNDNTENQLDGTNRNVSCNNSKANFGITGILDEPIPELNSIDQKIETAEDALLEIDLMQADKSSSLLQNELLFSPYSSEDLDMFNACIDEGDGTFSKAVQNLSVAYPERKKGQFSTHNDDCIGEKRMEDPWENFQSSGSSGQKSPTRQPPPNHQIVLKCTFHGCGQTFDRKDLFARHVFQHKTSWSFLPAFEENINATAHEVTSSAPSVSADGKVDELQTSLDTLELMDQPPNNQSTLSSKDLTSQDETCLLGQSIGRNYSTDGNEVFIPLQREEPNPASGSEDSSLLPPRYPGNNFSWFLKLKSKMFRPRLQAEYERIEWICGCGDALYADFKKKNSRETSRIAGILQAPDSIAPTRQTTVPLQAPPINLGLSGRATSSVSSIGSSFSSTGSQSISRNDSSSTDASSVTLESHNSPTPKFLELCANTGEHLKELGEIDLTNARCDGDLFGAIREKYLMIRGFRAKFWLLKPASISYVRFSVEQRRRVGILQKPLAVPPKSEVDAKRWIYDPCPLEGDPPIPGHLFLHYLECSRRSRKLFWMHRLPRKLKGSILNEGIASAAFGWGVHIDEGPNYKFILWANFIILSASGLFGALWTILKNDFQGAFGFACWFVAVFNTLVFAFIQGQKER